MVTLGELVMILDLARQGLSVSAIARRTGHDRKTIKKYLERSMQAPAYTPPSGTIAAGAAPRLAAGARRPLP